MESPESNNASNETPGQVSASQDNADADSNNPTDGAPAPGPRKARRRGRQAKDPLGQSVFFKVQRAEDLEAKLREYLANPTGDPEHTTLEFSFPVTAAFMVAARESKRPSGPDKNTPYQYSVFNKTAVSVIDALHTIKDPKEQMLMQKAISKTLVDTVQQADGFRYSFHNHWISREDQASRFSYFCNDSVLNKGRAANEGAAKIRMGVKVRKPVYECHGLISIKFSVTKMSLELHYKHVPLHQTYEERAPPPRRDSRRRKLLEIFHPEKLPQPKEKKKKGEQSPKTTKRKRRATEPLPQMEVDPQTPIVRDSSLQPLFDFLGSAGRLEEEQRSTATATGGDTAGSYTEPGAGGAEGDNAVDGTPSGPSKQRKNNNALPGMMSGFMSGEELTWGRKGSKATRSKRRRVTAPVSTEAQAQAQAQAPITASMPVTAETTTLPPNPPGPANEVDLLKARLQEAELKIRALEAEKNRSPVPPMPWTAPPQPGPPPPPGYPQPYYPPPAQFQHQPPPAQYQHHPPPSQYQNPPPPQYQNHPSAQYPHPPPPQWQYPVRPPHMAPLQGPPGPGPGPARVLAPARPPPPTTSSPRPGSVPNAPPAVAPTPAPTGPPANGSAPSPGAPRAATTAPLPPPPAAAVSPLPASASTPSPASAPVPASAPAPAPAPAPSVPLPISRPPSQNAAPLYGFVPSPVEIPPAPVVPAPAPQPNP